MTIPWPEWLPGWAQVLVLMAGLLFAILWMLVPFAVIGVKGRLDALAMQIDDLQAELRVMAVSGASSATRDGAEAAASEPLSEVLRQEDGDRGAERQAATPPVTRCLDPEDPECDIPAYERRPMARSAPPWAGEEPGDAAPLPPSSSPSPDEAPVASVAPMPPDGREAGHDGGQAATDAAGRAPARDGVPLRVQRAPMLKNGPADGDTGVRAAMARKVETGIPRTARWAERRQRSEPTLRWPPRR
ncbi:hypothetical protein [Novacetimonas pomaceti]|uniref:hypothetical protein n=1 Tax=Novacetimonas pomaceti TaxID=2021998 RepID=UPI001EF100C9|nr:hypothetical protein [Novacetimonas pomaceti]